MLREARLREGKPRVGKFVFAPGEEMQHDTSPHRLRLGEREVTAQCAALHLAYSRYLYVQYYPNWTRFEVRWFLSRALSFMGGVAGRCLIDNSSVILAGGSGVDAVMAPEMEVFSRIYGFEFRAHEIGDPKRKGVVERGFSYVERNFLAGRTFRDWGDLNEQVMQWCRAVNLKEKRSLGMSPHGAYLMERPHLRPLPKHPPPITQPLGRVVDSSGYVTVDTNRYSVPEDLIGKRVEVLKSPAEIQVYFDERRVAKHGRLLEKRRGHVTDPKHHQPLARRRLHAGACDQERLLRGQDPQLDEYLIQFKRRIRGRGVPHFRRLLSLMRTYPRPAFLAAVRQAHHYGLYDLARLEQMILSHVAGEFFQLQLEGDEPCF
jgi:Mu transposase, C-terminal domain